MRTRVPAALLTTLLLVAVGTAPVAAQSENIATVEGPRPGETTTLTARPYALAEGLSARALGVAGPDTTRWALRLIGAEGAAPIRLTQGGDTLSVLRVERPGTDEIGPTTVHVSQEAFLTMAETAAATVTVGDVQTALPAELRRAMRQIFETVTDKV